MVDKIREVVLADRRLTFWEIAETIGTSGGHVGHILYKILCMNTLSVR